MLEVWDPSDLTDHTILAQIYRVFFLMKADHVQKAIEGILGATDDKPPGSVRSEFVDFTC